MAKNKISVIDEDEELEFSSLARLVQLGHQKTFL